MKNYGRDNDNIVWYEICISFEWIVNEWYRLLFDDVVVKKLYLVCIYIGKY